MLTLFILGAAGFFTGSAAFYFVHRFVFHSKKESRLYRFLFNRWNPLAPIARWGREIHKRHHVEHIRSKKKGVSEELNMFFPWRVKLFMFSVVAGLFVASPAFALGVVSFFPFYSYRHTMVHRLHSSGKPLKKWMIHHLYHHEKNPNVNHSGTIPFIDKVFRSNEEPPESWIKKNYLTRV